MFFFRNIGELWTSNQVFGNQHHELVLKAGDKSEFFFKQLIEPPTGGIACLDFRYKKISSGAQFYHFILGLSLHSHCRRLQLSVDSVCLAPKRLIVVENNIKNLKLKLKRSTWTRCCCPRQSRPVHVGQGAGGWKKLLGSFPHSCGTLVTGDLPQR